LTTSQLLYSVPNREGEASRGRSAYSGSDRLPVDAQLIALAKEDRDEAFLLLYNAYRGRIYTFLLRLAGSGELADDLMQETFEKAYKALGRLASDQRLLPWLYRIANNTAIDHVRRRRRFTWLPWIAIRGTAEEPVARDEHAAASLRSDLREVLTQLPPDNVAALLLHALEGYSYVEIAEIQGISMAAARSRIARARAAFKDLYRPE
jgi:RNA polymerase sigma-70 factor (ECF subfamily)